MSVAGIGERSAFGSLLSDPSIVRELSPGLYTAFPEGTSAAAYDRKAAVYDAVVGRSVYHRLFWGTSPRSFGRFGRAAFDAADDGPFAEIGCGSLLFTAPMYRGAGRRDAVVLVDRRLGCCGVGSRGSR